MKRPIAPDLRAWAAMAADHGDAAALRQYHAMAALARAARSLARVDEHGTRTDGLPVDYWPAFQRMYRALARLERGKAKR